MNRNEILERSRRENIGYDEREKNIHVQAGQLGGTIGGIVCMLMYAATAFVGRLSFSVYFSMFSIYLSILGSSLLFKGIKIKKKHEIVIGAAELLFSVLFFILYIVFIVRE